MSLRLLSYMKPFDKYVDAQMSKIGTGDLVEKVGKIASLSATAGERKNPNNIRSFHQKIEK